MVDYLITRYSNQNARDAPSNVRTKTQFDDYSKLKQITDKTKLKQMRKGLKRKMKLRKLKVDLFKGFEQF